MDRWAEEWREQRRLWQLWLQAGDAPTRAALIESYQPMVRGIVRRTFRAYRFRWCLVEDIQQSAYVRLVELFDRWEPDGSADPTSDFLNYAYVAIARQVRSEQRQLIEQCRQTLSLDAPLSGSDDDGRPRFLGDTLAAPGSDPLERLIDQTYPAGREDLQGRFLLALQCLGKRDQQLLDLLFVRCMSIRRARALLGFSDQGLRAERDRLVRRLQRLAEGAGHAQR